MVRMWLAKADPDWFDFLAAQPELDEVNLWAPDPSAQAGAMQPGELVLFGMGSPRDTIGGFGVLDRANDYPLSLVWEALGIKNGVAGLAQLREKARGRGVAGEADHAIACRIVVEPVFLPARLWLPRPAGEGAYDTATPEGLLLWERLHEAAGLASAGSSGLRDRQLAFRGQDERYGAPRLVRPRRGQGAFRLAVTDAYRRQCAISGGKVLPALEAAHIRAYGEGGEHDVANGLLLRRDIHSVFDAGYITFDDDLRLVVSERVRTVFDDGEEYRRLHGQRLSVPADPALRPHRDHLRWHRSERFERFVG